MMVYVSHDASMWKYLTDLQILGTTNDVLVNDNPWLFAFNNTRKLLLVIIVSQVVLSTVRFRFSFK